LKIMNSKNWPTKKLREISDDEIKARFFVALDQLFINDSFLLKNGANEGGDKLERGAHERSVAHKLAEYLQAQFPGWYVDCEYNRDGLQVKTQKGQKRVFPDVIVHHRGIKDNLLVIELKTSKESNSKDLEKLRQFTEKGKYEYQLGVFIRLTKNKLEKPIWYKDGQQKN